MALGRYIKRARRAGAKRHVRINKITKKGRMEGRFCVVAKRGPGDKKVRKAFKGAKPSQNVFYGCFPVRAKAEARARLVEGMKHLGKIRRSRKARKARRSRR